MDRNLCAMNNQLTPINIYLDLSKAFDILDQNIHVNELKYYRVYTNYLLGRNQDVDLDHTKSNIHEVYCRILQGLVMGPLIFHIFINDIVEAISLFDLIMYADDTTLVSTLETFGNRKKSIFFIGGFY